MPRKPVAREKLLTAFEHLVLSEGERAATLDAVAARAGVSKGGLLYHFPHRQALVDAALVRSARAGATTPLVVVDLALPHDTDPAVADFASAYEAEFGEAAGTYAAEAYDAATIFLDGIGEGISDREAMLEFVNGYDEAGITKQLSFDESGEPSEVKVYAYKVEGGEIVPEGEIG